ncbi:MAG: hypothetical protein HYV60_04760, partial [Planctomycetia bacterium]|nr:hypothetical protein [Planctomycetia bacterium]
MRIELILALLLGFVIGCSSEPPAVSVTPTPSPVKAMLEDLANTGEMGSGMMDIESGLNALKQTDAAKADKLLKEYAELQAAAGPEEIKAKAKAMA